MLTTGWNKQPQNIVPSEHMETQNPIIDLFLGTFFCSPRIKYPGWMLSLNRLAELSSWEGLWQENRQDFSHVFQQNVSRLIEVIHTPLSKSMKISLS